MKSDALRIACMAAGITIADAKSSSHKPELAYRRRLVMAMLQARGWSTPQIGEALNRHYTTVVNGLKEIRGGRKPRKPWGSNRGQA